MFPCASTKPHKPTELSFSFFKLTVLSLPLFLQATLEFLRCPGINGKIYGKTKYDLYGHGGLLFMASTSLFLALVRKTYPIYNYYRHHIGFRHFKLIRARRSGFKKAQARLRRVRERTFPSRSLNRVRNEM